jgi:hypothetical protein
MSEGAWIYTWPVAFSEPVTGLKDGFMRIGKPVFAQVMAHLPVTTFCRRIRALWWVSTRSSDSCLPCQSIGMELHKLVACLWAVLSPHLVRLQSTPDMLARILNVRS